MNPTPGAEAPIVLDLTAQNLLFREAHTANTFTGEPVTDEQIEAVHELIKFAPTSTNCQPLRGVLARSASARERLSAHMWPNNKAKTAAAPLTAVLAADLHFHEELPRLWPHMPNARDLYAADDEARHDAALLNASLQIAYFIIGLRAAGLAAGPMGGFDEPAVTKEFFPDGEHRALVVVNIGRPAADAFRPRAPRLEYHETFTVV